MTAADNLLTIIVLFGFGWLIYYSMNNHGSIDKIKTILNKFIGKGGK